MTYNIKNVINSIAQQRTKPRRQMYTDKIANRHQRARQKHIIHIISVSLSNTRQKNVCICDLKLISFKKDVQRFMHNIEANLSAAQKHAMFLLPPTTCEVSIWICAHNDLNTYSTPLLGLLLIPKNFGPRLSHCLLFEHRIQE